VEIHRGVTVTRPHPRHWHEEFHACAITGGGGFTECGGVAHETPTGSMFFLPPGEVHSNRAYEHGCSYTNVYISQSQVQAAMQRLTGSETVPDFPVLIFDSGIHLSFLELCRVLEHSRSRLHRETAFLEFFASLTSRFRLRSQFKPERHPDAIRTVREYLDAHFDREIGLDELSRLTNLSPFYLNRTFGRELGIPPHAYQIQVRISRAKALLRQRMPIADVAFRTGFSDQSHFTRFFKKNVGVTPGEFHPEIKNVQDQPYSER
jgi:AraC-like DNA-binding protein